LQVIVPFECRAGCLRDREHEKSPVCSGLKGPVTFGKTSRFRSGQIDEPNTSRTNMPARRHGDGNDAVRNRRPSG
jgi:hypothetical protein